MERKRGMAAVEGGGRGRSGGSVHKIPTRMEGRGRGGASAPLVGSAANLASPAGGGAEAGGVVRRETSPATDGSEGWWEENCVSDERCWEMLGEALGPSPERASPSKHGGDWKLVEGMASLRSGEGEGKACKEPGEALSEAGAFGGGREEEKKVGRLQV